MCVFSINTKTAMQDAPGAAASVTLGKLLIAGVKLVDVNFYLSNFGLLF